MQLHAPTGAGNDENGQQAGSGCREYDHDRRTGNSVSTRATTMQRWPDYIPHLPPLGTFAAWELQALYG